MDEFHTGFIGSPVAHSRYIAAHADALFLDTRERLLACNMPIGFQTLLVCVTIGLQAAKFHADFWALPHGS